MVAESPQSISFDLGRTNLTVNQRCGNCKHLKRIAHPAYEKPCVDLGMQEISRPCARFSADPTKIKMTTRSSRNLVEIFKDLSDDKLCLLASLANEERRSRRFGFSFGQVVYLNVFGGEYLSNYRRMKVVSADKEYVNLVADDGFTAMVYTKNVLSPTEWREKKRWLISHEKLVDPNYRKYEYANSTAEIKIQKIKSKLTALEFDANSKHKFTATQGVLSRKSKFSDPTCTTPITQLIKVR